MTTFPFSILSPGGTIISGDVTQIEIRTYEGSLGILANHEPLAAACPAGIVRLQQDGVWVRFKTEACLLTTDGEKATILTPFAQYAGAQ
jgi:F-type H+-transporting ATPase subunit epsilon